MAHASREAAWRLRGAPDGELEELFDGLWELSAVGLWLQAGLPKLFSFQLARLAEAVKDDEPGPELLEAVVRRIDTLVERARLARAVIARAGAGEIDGRLAAAALVDLGSGSWRLLRAGVLEALAVRVGVARTPGGILLAA